LKKDEYHRHLTGLFEVFLKNGDRRRIMEYLASNSNLPGPRGNLELAHAFADSIEQLSDGVADDIWTLILRLTEIGSDKAPTGDPMEFIPFCGAVAIGALSSVHPKYRRRAMLRLKELAHDRRWRMREAVAMGIQRIMARDSERTLNDLMSWIDDEKWLQMRAAAAGVAEPALLKDKKSAEKALEIHKAIFSRLVGGTERRSEEFKILRQGLAYTLSVIVSAIPGEGFQYMSQLIESKDKDVLWILKENLKKNRLTKKYAEDVQKMMNILKEKGI